MATPLTPRNVVKSLVRGERPARPLLMPVAFSVGSRLENLALRDFTPNPTKITNALRQIRAALQIDGLTCYFPPPAGSELGENLDAPEDMLKQRGINVACEVLRRLKVMLKDEPALMVGVPGPLTLASQAKSTQSEPEPTPPEELVDSAAQVTAALAKQFVEAGADVVLLVESSLTLSGSETCEWWGGLLDPIINVIRFYDALPVLCLNENTFSSDILTVICSRTWECVLCFHLSAATSARFQQCRAAAGPGIGLPSEVFSADSSATLNQARNVIRELKPSFITTFEDLPAQADLNYLARALKALH